MNRRDFLRLSTTGRQRVLELSCERLYVRYVDAQSGAGRREEPGDVDAAQSWDGEPPTEIETPTAGELFAELDRELSNADVLRVLDRDWLAGSEFRREVEARVEAFSRRGGRVEFRDSTSHPRTGSKASGLRSLAIFFAVIFVATMWPVYPLVSRVRPFVFGLPFSLVYVLGLTVISFVALLLFDRRASRDDER